MKSQRKLGRITNLKRVTMQGALIASLGLITIAITVPAIASTWVANTPESIKIKENDTSYTMVYGDTLWAISTKININVQTLASINNIDLTTGEEYYLAVGTVIKWDKQGNLIAETANGHQINDGLKTNDSNKVIADKAIGEDVTNDVKDNNIPENQINGNPNNTENDDSKDSETPNNEDKNTSEDKWKDLKSEEINGSLRIGPFKSYEEAQEYFDYRQYLAGNIVDSEDSNWYIYLPINSLDSTESNS